MARIKTQNGLLIKLLRTKVGEEVSLIKELRQENSSAVFFKAIGQYDLFEISPLSSLNDTVIFNTDIRIHSINSFPCYIYGQPDEILDLLKESAFSSLIFIKLHDDLFKLAGMNGIDAAAKLCQKCGEECNVKVHPCVGLGFYEIILLLQHDSIEHVFNYLGTIRCSQIDELSLEEIDESTPKCLIVDTATVPLVSYSNVIENKNWDALNGKISPVVKIKCIPGHEKSLARHLPENCFDLLGANDLLCTWKEEPIEFGELVKFIISFRENAPKNTLLQTSTELYGKNKASLKPKRDKFEEAGPTTPPLFTELQKVVEEKQKVNKFLIGEITNIVSMINSLIGNRSFDQGGDEIIYSILMYLNGLLASYLKVIDEEQDNAQIAHVEYQLLTYAHYIKMAVAQQFSNSAYGDHNTNAFSALASSLFRVVKSISVIPEQLFQAISESDPPEQFKKIANQHDADEETANYLLDYKLPWAGFLFLDLHEGYRILDPSEIISVPYQDIFNFLNWITLSHEVSHGYYARIDFQQLEAEYFSKNLPEFTEGLRDDEIDNLRYATSDTSFELFAHWFDYKHFFDGDFEFYLWSIWRTYLDIPRVHQFKTDYWLRTLFIVLCHKREALFSEIRERYNRVTSNKEYHIEVIDIFKKELSHIYDWLSSKFPNQMALVKLTDTETLDVSCAVFQQHILCDIFENRYFNIKVHHSANKAYDNLDKDIDKILSGNIITTKIDNPFLLIREILRRYYQDDNFTGMPSEEVSIAFIFSLWESSRHYVRPLPREDENGD